MKKELRSLTAAAALIAMQCTVSAQGDNCANAVLINPGPQTADGPFSGAGASQADAIDADWYAFDPTDPGYITIGTCGGTVDTRVFVHVGSCGSLTTLASDDDGCPYGYPPGNSLVANVPVTPGNTYYIEFDDRWSGLGFDWTFEFHTCAAPLPPTFTATDTTITVEWPPLSPGAIYHVEYGLPGFTQGTGTELFGTEGTDGPPVEITGLTIGTDYEVFLWMECGGETSPNVGAWPASTTGNPLVVNEDCTGALPIACGDVLTGSTVDANDDAVTDCGTDISAPGIWYTFSGIGGAVTLSTCYAADYDTKINVFAGGCATLNCIGGNDDAEFCDVTSEYTFIADINETYSILLQGYDGEVGEFTLTMTCVSCPPPQAVFSTPSDVEAEIYWSSFNPGSAFTIEYGPTGFVPGTGILFSGINGVDGPPALITGLTAATSYDYYISEDCGGGDVSVQAGPYSVTTLTDPPPVNTFCDNALAITCGDDLDGSTNNAVLSVAPQCGPADITAPGLWYTFTGNGQDVAMSTCSQASYDTKISVFSGTCVSLQCEAGNDDGPNCAANTSDLLLATQSGATYYVLVHGYQANTGDFTLSMDCFAPCTPAVSNDDCGTATPIATQALGTCVPLSSTNLCAYSTPVLNPPCDPYANIADVWFSFNTSSNADHTLTITAGTAELVNVALYQACGDLNYVDCFTDVQAPIDLSGLDTNTEYYVRVWNGGFGDAGTFTICDEADLPNVIAENVTTEMRAYPVPAHTDLFISGIAAGTRVLVVTDLQGRVVMQVPVKGTSQHIDLNQLAEGTYLLRGNNRGQALRFVVE